MGSADRIAILWLSAADWDLISELRGEWARDYLRVNQPRSPYDHNPTFKQTPRVTFVVANERIYAVGIGRRVSNSGDVAMLVRVDSLSDLSNPLLISEVSDHLDARGRRLVLNSLRNGGLLGVVGGALLVDAIRELRPELADAISRLRTLGTVDADRWRITRELVREQRDALALGLEASGLDSRELLDASMAQRSLGTPYLTALADSKAQASESALIRHDLQVFGDWVNSIDGEIYDAVRFTDPIDPARRVTAIYADKEGLERVTGTDLIYYSAHSPGFVLVQYKRMARSEGSAPGAEWGYRPDKQLAAEIARMKALNISGTGSTFEDWRLNSGPFFVKLVQSDLRRPERNRLSPGMYFPLDLFELLVATPSVMGPRGRPRIGWHNSRRYMSNTAFVHLLQQGWIGSSGEATAVIGRLVNSMLGVGHGVVVVRDETDQAHAKPLRRG